ncbi:MAG: hypothetical protein LBD88_04700 [Candidatus Peribacteria bacterium]|jgi:hypothetical protein|nr:hypothetical protein [Candidatus Peribacteria bacterium]
MIKFFNVTKEEEYEEIPDDGEIVEPEEVGQIAVDILETKFEMILLAPVA